ncbi:MAG: NADPH-dependent oxidoreductase [Phycisphaerae bacterium]
MPDVNLPTTAEIENAASQSQSAMATMLAHHTVRAFRDQPLPEGVLENIVTAGTRASTSSNMQAYAVIHIESPELKTEVAQLCADQKQIHQSAAFLAICADLRKLVLCCQQYDGDASAAGTEEAALVAIIDAALVMQNMALAAESLGLGICMIGAMRNNPGAVRDALALPQHVIALSGLCIGYPDDDATAKPRLPLSATFFKNQYPSDTDLAQPLAEYDDVQSAWYQERDLHPKDPRWTSVMARRLAATRKREELGVILREQGFLQSLD